MLFGYLDSIVTKLDQLQTIADQMNKLGNKLERMDQHQKSLTTQIDKQATWLWDQCGRKLEWIGSKACAIEERQMLVHYREHEMRRILSQNSAEWNITLDSGFFTRQVRQEPFGLALSRLSHANGSCSVTLTDRIVSYVVLDHYKVRESER